MQYHAGEIGHRGGRAQARVFQLACEPPQALALEVEVVQRQRQRQEQSLVAVPRPGALAVLLVQGKERAQVAVVVDAHHVGRGVKWPASWFLAELYLSAVAKSTNVLETSGSKMLTSQETSFLPKRWVGDRW